MTTAEHRSGRPLRLALLGMAVPGIVIGLWAAFAPRSFYDSFPGAGRVWVAVDGPYNEHLVRDIGQLNLALATVTVAAAIVLTLPFARAVAVGWLVVGMPHLVYHATHLEGFERSDRIPLVGSLALTLVIPVVVLVLARPSTRPEPAETG